MQKNTDFSNMTLEELTPIVSMRPGKEYTREELRAARIAFMTALGMHNAESAVETEALAFEEAEDVAAFSEEETAEEAPVAEEIPEEAPCAEAATEELPAEEPLEEEPTEEVLAEEVPVEEPAALEEVAEDEPSSPFIDETPILPEEETEEPVALQEETSKVEADEFILENESRPARLLYILYAYLLVPILAVESILFLVASVAVAVCVPDIPFLSLQVFCAMIYPVVIAVAWHQLLHRTEFGLLLNRSLIAIGIFRAISHLVPGNGLVLGIIELAVFSLFFIFFVGYDNTFIIPSPKKQHVR